MKVLSLFDGMACGMLAMQEAGIEVDKYVAYEIDKYAVETATHNFPIIEEKGDVFKADFSEYKGFDFLIGGSPCTYWSIAQTKNRETVASGMGWELFSQYVRALKEAKPKYFLYENNKSMSAQIRQSISETFGFEPICINSALVSAQNRNRLYWVGIRQTDGNYKKANIEQPEDKGILLKDVLETASTTWLDKAHTIDATYYKGGTLESDKLHQNASHLMVAEPIKALSEKEMDYMLREVKGGRNHFDFGYTFDATKDKSPCLTTGASRVPYCVVAEPINIDSIKGAKDTEHYFQYDLSGKNNGSQDQGVNYTDCKSPCVIVAHACDMKVFEPVCVEERGRYDENGKIYQHFEANDTDKTNALTTVAKDNLIAEPIRGMKYELESVTGKDSGVVGMLDMPGTHDIGRRVYGDKGKAPTVNTCGGGNLEPKVFTKLPECFRVKEATTKGYTDIEPGNCVDMSMPNSKTRQGRNMETKSNCLQTSCGFYQYCGTVKAPIYKVENGMIFVKDKQYPIKLVDGYYIIRKLTVKECMRLQTVPEWYEFPVSNSQAYKMLGNGWTVSVIAHLLKGVTATE